MKKSPLHYILVLALILRFIGINQSFWLDEATSGTVARDLSFVQIITQLAPKDFHPPLYYLLLKALSTIFGTSEIGLRLFSVLTGVGTVYIVYLIGKSIASLRVGFISALLLAIAPLHIYYSHEARMYSLATFLTSLCIYFFILWLKKGKQYWLLLYSITITLLFLTDYLPLLIVPALILYLIVSKNNTKKIISFLLAHIVPLVVFMLYSPVFIQQIQSASSIKDTNWWGNLGNFSIKNIALLPIKFIIGRISFDNKFIYGAMVSIGAVLWGVPLYFSLIYKKWTKLLWMWLIVPTLLGLALSLFVPVFSYFRFLFLLPVLTLLAALGLEKTKEKVFMLIFSLLILFNGLMGITYLRNYDFHREDWKSAIGTIQAQAQNTNVAIVFPANSQMEAVRYYWPDAPLYPGREANSVSAQKVWLSRYVWEVFDANDDTRLAIEAANYKKITEHNFRGVVFWEYNRENENSN